MMNLYEQVEEAHNEWVTAQFDKAFEEHESILCCRNCFFYRPEEGNICDLTGDEEDEEHYCRSHEWN